MAQNLGVAKIKGIVVPEIGLKNFGTFEKQTLRFLPRCVTEQQEVDFPIKSLIVSD